MTLWSVFAQLFKDSFYCDLSRLMNWTYLKYNDYTKYNICSTWLLDIVISTCYVAIKPLKITFITCLLLCSQGYMEPFSHQPWAKNDSDGDLTAIIFGNLSDLLVVHRYVLETLVM